MKRRILKIENPCSEDVSKMSSSEKGKHCKQCEKEVIDLRNMSDESIRALLNDSTGQICAMASSGQLNRSLKRKNRFDAKVPMAISLSLLSLVSSIESFGNSELPTQEISNSITLESVSELNGVIKDEFGKPIENVRISILSIESVLFSNKKGEFVVNLSDHNIKKDSIHLVYSKKGYLSKTKKVSLSTSELSTTVLVRKDIKVIRGKILDETNEGVFGANIVVKGTTVGTASDLNGNFEIHLPEGKTVIVVSAIMYSAKEVEIDLGSQEKISVQLKEDVLGLTEVVVIAGTLSYEGQYKEPKKGVFKRIKNFLKK